MSLEDLVDQLEEELDMTDSTRVKETGRRMAPLRD
jgi:hypothetical protein